MTVEDIKRGDFVYLKDMANVTDIELSELDYKTLLIYALKEFHVTNCKLDRLNEILEDYL